MAIGQCLLMPSSALASTTGEKGYYCYADVSKGYVGLTMVNPNNKEEVVYCYNHDKTQPVPDKAAAVDYCQYERFGFYDGMNNLGDNRGDKSKVDKVATVLMIGYPNNGLGSAMTDFAKKSYQEFQEKNGKDRPSSYTFDDFQREMTQAAIWQIDNPTGQYIEKSTYAKALYDYAQSYPLNKRTAYASDVKLVDEKNQEINQDNPLIIDSHTLKSQNFYLKDYDGTITLDSLPSGYQLVNANTHQDVSGIQPNHTYYIQADKGENARFEIDFKLMTLRDSYFYQPLNTSWDLQNLVNANITRDKLKTPVVLINEPKTDVKIEKVDSDRQGVKGAQLEIVDSTGKSIEQWESDGSVHNISLSDGTYILKELKAPAGYKKAADIAFEVKDGKVYCDKKVVEKITMVDKKQVPWKPISPSQYKVAIEKVDSDRQGVKGAQLEIVDSTGKSIEQWESDGETHYISLFDGKYILKELKAPAGYKKAADITFEVKDGKVYCDKKVVKKITMVDKKQVPWKSIGLSQHMGTNGKEEEKKDEGKGQNTSKNVSPKSDSQLVNQGNNDEKSWEGILPKTGKSSNIHLIMIGTIIIFLATVILVVLIRKRK